MLFPVQFIEMLDADLTLHTKVSLKRISYSVKGRLTGSRDSKEANPFNHSWGSSLYITTRNGQEEIGLLRMHEKSSPLGDSLEVRSYLKLSTARNRDEALLEYLFRLSVALGYEGSFHMEITREEKEFFMEKGFEIDRERTIDHNFSVIKPSMIQIQKWQEQYKLQLTDLSHGLECRKNRKAEVDRMLALEDEGEEVTFKPAFIAVPRCSDSSANTASPMSAITPPPNTEIVKKIPKFSSFV